MEFTEKHHRAMREFEKRESMGLTDPVDLAPILDDLEKKGILE